MDLLAARLPLHAVALEPDLLARLRALAATSPGGL